MTTLLPYEFLEHTVDIQLRVTGKRLEDLFVNAARGMMELLFGEDIVKLNAERKERITLDATDRDTLLVDWLSLLLLKAATEYRTFVDFHIESLDGRHLVASVGSVEALALDEIKAVTYHELHIVESSEGCEVLIIFDV